MLTTLLFGDFHCITFYGLLYWNHKDLDVLLRFSLFFISYLLNRQVRISATLFIEVNQTSWNKSLRQPCNICEAESYKTNSFPCLIQKVVRFARIIELSNMIHWLYFLTPSHWISLLRAYCSGKPFKRLPCMVIVDSLNYRGYKSLLILRLSRQRLVISCILLSFYRNSKYYDCIKSLLYSFYILRINSNYRPETSWITDIHYLAKALYVTLTAFYAHSNYVMFIPNVLPTLLAHYLWVLWLNYLITLSFQIKLD